MYLSKICEGGQTGLSKRNIILCSIMSQELYLMTKRQSSFSPKTLFSFDDKEQIPMPSNICGWKKRLLGGKNDYARSTYPWKFLLPCAFPTWKACGIAISPHKYDPLPSTCLSNIKIRWPENTSHSTRKQFLVLQSICYTKCIYVYMIIYLLSFICPTHKTPHRNP